jgi:2-polyprenyl-3-methyl-5-hydroxy-6-metoxy-1,4-benzoquinol methylase
MTAPLAGHLDFYKAHGISPVRYADAGTAAHFDRRDSLYRSLGLPPAAFRGARVLEVAPGSGQNSLYVASCGPASLDLVEPNPAGRADIEATYAAHAGPVTVPRLHPAMLQEFEPDGPYDVVICENWLGSRPDELALLSRLAGFLAPGGVLVVTAVPLAGFFPNVMRTVLARRVAGAETPFEERTARLVAAFGPHLATIAAMTRSHRDWVHDCMINPAYLRVALPIEEVLRAAGPGAEVLATFPRFSTDWRWFKSLAGEGRAFNAHLLGQLRGSAPSFLDYRTVRPPLADAAAADRLDGLFADAWRAAVAADDAGLSPATPADAPALAAVGDALDALRAALAPVTPDLAPALDELADALRRPALSPADIAAMPSFGRLFGRETVYVSLTRPREG